MAISPKQCLAKNEHDQKILDELEKRIDYCLAWEYGRNNKKRVEFNYGFNESVNPKIFGYLQSMYNDAGWTIKEVIKELPNTKYTISDPPPIKPETFAITYLIFEPKE